MLIWARLLLAARKGANLSCFTTVLIICASCPDLGVSVCSQDSVVMLVSTINNGYKSPNWFKNINFPYNLL